MLGLVFRGAVIGAGATALIDLWAVLLARGFGQRRPNWALVGRWFWHLRPQLQSLKHSIFVARLMQSESSPQAWLVLVVESYSSWQSHSSAGSVVPMVLFA